MTPLTLENVRTRQPITSCFWPWFSLSFLGTQEGRTLWFGNKIRADFVSACLLLEDLSKFIQSHLNGAGSAFWKLPHLGISRPYLLTTLEGTRTREKSQTGACRCPGAILAPHIHPLPWRKGPSSSWYKLLRMPDDFVHFDFHLPSFRSSSSHSPVMGGQQQGPDPAQTPPLSSLEWSIYNTRPMELHLI